MIDILTTAERERTTHAAMPHGSSALVIYSGILTMLLASFKGCGARKFGLLHALSVGRTLRTAGSRPNRQREIAQCVGVVGCQVEQIRLPLRWSPTDTGVGVARNDVIVLFQEVPYLVIVVPLKQEQESILVRFQRGSPRRMRNGRNETCPSVVPVSICEIVQFDRVQAFCVIDPRTRQRNWQDCVIGESKFARVCLGYCRRRWDDRCGCGGRRGTRRQGCRGWLRSCGRYFCGRRVWSVARLSVYRTPTVIKVVAVVVRAGVSIATGNLGEARQGGRVGNNAMRVRAKTFDGAAVIYQTHEVGAEMVIALHIIAVERGRRGVAVRRQRERQCLVAGQYGYGGNHDDSDRQSRRYELSHKLCSLPFVSRVGKQSRLSLRRNERHIRMGTWNGRNSRPLRCQWMMPPRGTGCASGNGAYPIQAHSGAQNAPPEGQSPLGHAMYETTVTAGHSNTGIHHKQTEPRGLLSLERVGEGVGLSGDDIRPGGIERLRSQRRVLTTADTAGALSDAAATCILCGRYTNTTPLTGRHRSCGLHNSTACIVNYLCEFSVIINLYNRDVFVSIWPIRYNWRRLAQGVRSTVREGR